MSFHQSSVFVDYLDCTFSPEDNPVPEVERVLLRCRGHCDRPPFGSKANTVWVVGDGKIVVSENSRWVRVSASGAAIEELRLSGAFEEYVNVLGSSLNKVTRLDVAVDVFRDAPPVIAALRKRYPVTCKLSHKPVKTRWFGSSRDDGVETGTFYVGDRKNSKVSAACYDKQEETFQRTGVNVSPVVRYEIRLKSGVKPTLTDALDPTPVFWHYAGGTLLPLPGEPVVDWQQGRDFEPWVNSWLPPTPAMSMMNRVSDSPELRALAKLACEAGPNGRLLLDRLIAEELDRQMEALSAAACGPETSPISQPERPATNTLSRALGTEGTGVS